MANLKRFWWFIMAAIIIIVLIAIVIIIAVSLLSESKISADLDPNRHVKPSNDVHVVRLSKTTSEITKGVWPKSLPKSPDCGRAAISDKIVGGNNVQFDEHPWTALLYYEYYIGNTSMRSYDCGGTLINHEYVLTAAHCLLEEKLLIGVLLGEHNLNKTYDCLTTDPDDCPNDEPSNECTCAEDKPKLYEIAEEFQHPDYDKVNKANDIALIKLNETVKYNEITKPVCLPAEDFYRHDLGKTAFAIGWGLTNSSDEGSKSDIKKIVGLPVWDRVLCDKYIQATSEARICAGGEDGKDSCSYDSGGPLVRMGHISPSWYLEGIVSFGNECGIKGLPGVYANVSAHMDWILATISNVTIT